MNTSALTHTTEKRGTLTYQNPDYTFTTVQGWFRINNQRIIMRKIGGRNRFNVCSAEMVESFTPDN